MAENKYYERKIKYLDLLENGERVGGAGFVRVEVKGSDVSLALTVRGLHPTDTYEREVMLRDDGGEYAVGRITLKEGQGQFTYHTVMDYSRLRGIRIAIGGAREISCKWQEEKKAYPGRAGDVSDSETSGDDAAQKDTGEQTEQKKNQETQVISWDEIKAAEESLEKVKSMRFGTEGDRAGKTAAAQRASSNNRTSGREKRPVRLMEDKWQQIWAIYPHIHPFQDEREYLSIGPADFVLLSGAAYRAANNSFLLHGYYNYDHLILAKMESRGEISYYIGVPGNYYEREKQVALMFGFESFECGTEPAQAGDFGYYMMRTQL